MLLNCFVLGTGTGFSIPLSEKVSIKEDEYSIKSLTIDILKKYIWEREKDNLKDLTNNASKLELWHVNVEEVVDIFNENDIVQKLEGNKMKPNFLFSNYFSGQPPAGKIHIIIQPPATTGKCLLIFYFSNKENFAICFLYNVLITFVSACFVLDQGLTDISRDIANLGYLPRQGTYKLVFFNSSVLFLTIRLFQVALVVRCYLLI